MNIIKIMKDFHLIGNKIFFAQKICYQFQENW